MKIKKDEVYIRIQYKKGHKIIQIIEKKDNFEKSKRIDEYEDGNSTISTILKTLNGIKIIGPFPLYNKNHNHV